VKEHKARDSLVVDGKGYLNVDEMYMGRIFYWYMEPSTHLSTSRRPHLLGEKVDAVYP
jgi:hypothetical protein